MKVWTETTRGAGQYMAWLVLDGIDEGKQKRVLIGRSSTKQGAEFLISVFDGLYMSSRKPMSIADLVDQVNRLPQEKPLPKIKKRGFIIYD